MNKKRYTVMVDDNFHYMDEESRYKRGEFSTYEFSDPFAVGTNGVRPPPVPCKRCCEVYSKTISKV